MPRDCLHTCVCHVRSLSTLNPTYSHGLLKSCSDLCLGGSRLDTSTNQPHTHCMRSTFAFLYAAPSQPGHAQPNFTRGYLHATRLCSSRAHLVNASWGPLITLGLLQQWWPPKMPTRMNTSTAVPAFATWKAKGTAIPTKPVLFLGSKII